jgi:hypothetical protein
MVELDTQSQGKVDRRLLLRGSAALGAGVAGAAALTRFGFAAQQDAATPESATASPTAGDATPAIAAAANAFLDTLSDDEKSAVLFDWTDTAQKQRWSNFPQGLFERDGLMWGNLGESAQNAWLAVMQVTLSAEGYTRVMAEWAADDALAASDGGAGGAAPGGNFAANGTPQAGGPQGGNGAPPNGGPGGANSSGGMQMNYGRQYYWVALIGQPSETDPWQWQWGGHHVTINATIVGSNLALTPSFIGVQPATYTDVDGNTVRPLGDIEDEAFALINSLDATQQQAAILGDTYVDLVLGPGQDGKVLQPEGLSVTDLTGDQRTALLHLITHYTGLANDEDAGPRLEEVTSTLDDTYIAWYGPTEAGSAAYFRVAGPRIVIEYSPQGMGGNAADHIHGIYRDPSNDYGALYTGITIES